MRKMRCHYRLFTIVELMVVIAIIVILVAVLLPAMNKAKGVARDIQCTSNWRQCTAALFMYAGDNLNCIPPYNSDTKSNPPYLSWQDQIFSYVYPALNKPLAQLIYVDDYYVPYGVFKCPAQTQAGWSYRFQHYGLNGYFANFESLSCLLHCNLTKLKSPSTRCLGMDSCSAMAADSVLNWGLRHKGGSGVNVLYADGHVLGAASNSIPIPGSYTSFWGQFLGY